MLVSVAMAPPLNMQKKDISESATKRLALDTVNNLVSDNDNSNINNNDDNNNAAGGVL